MKLYLMFETALHKLLKQLWVWFIALHEVKNILRKYHLFRNVKLTDDEKAAVDKFYKEHYGKKVLHLWHRLYKSYTGKFDPAYIPEYIFTTKLEPKSNIRANVMPLENKNLFPVLFNGRVPKVRMPKTFVMCLNGRYFDAQRTMITREEAIEILKTQPEAENSVIKVTVDTSSGRDVRILKLVDGVDQIGNEAIESIIDHMGKNFVVQERIRPHAKFAALYPKAINTLRVVSYMTDNGIHTAPIIMRIGQGGGMVDNAHAGGIFIGVESDGRLTEEAFTEYQKRSKIHPDTGVVYKGYQIPFVKEIREAAVELHKQIPMLQYVSWDFTIDENDDIILIEANLHSQTVWFVQMAHGRAFFGEDTAEFLQKARRRS